MEVVNNVIPMVVEQDGRTERSFDIYSRLLRERNVFLTGEVNDQSASIIVAQLLFLEADDPKKDINFYINSPGGSVSAGLSIKNTMDYIKCDVSTIGLGMCASMGAFLLASGKQGKRIVLPDTTVMIHQVLGGYQGQCTDMEIHTKFMVDLKTKLNHYLTDYTYGKRTYEEMVIACERDNFLTAEQALNEFGLIDKIVKSRNEI